MVFTFFYLKGKFIKSIIHLLSPFPSTPPPYNLSFNVLQPDSLTHGSIETAWLMKIRWKCHMQISENTLRGKGYSSFVLHVYWNADMMTGAEAVILGHEVKTIAGE